MKVFVVLLAVAATALAAPSSDISPRIVGGQDARRGQFPYQISLQACILSLSCQHICGGTIVSPTVIVTAAHCLPNNVLYNFRIIAGILNLNDNNVERQVIDVARTSIHPGYNVNSQNVQPHDIALLFLRSRLTYNTQVQPARLPTQGFYPTGNAILSGWGSTSPDTNRPVVPNTLQTITIPVIPNITTCFNELQRLLGSRPPLDLNGGNVCTQPARGVSACVGDSGGPLVSNNVLIGVVSWGVVPCGNVGAPNVFANVGGYVSWLAPQITDL